MIRGSASLCCLWVLCWVPAATLRAQGSAGQIEGTVRDEQGGVLPGVVMTVRNQESGVTRNLTTENDGRFAFPALAPGRYTVRAELSGFGVSPTPATRRNSASRRAASSRS